MCASWRDIFCEVFFWLNWVGSGLDNFSILGIKEAAALISI